ncbi:D-alanyl-D-alanine carboxypeptidase family protein [uncultured Flavonifractor sp.]|uniref:D-alanyl-D-alanine carboxypeptidase family protein n=1 Tax=uncultured Flavonifractor sp. TaxID=1193534 RepID=UPI00262FFC07|nr:D-alanyl-D-alanine carboxypeptidase family protein [uncultured Flavonifractor sp.]
MRRACALLLALLVLTGSARGAAEVTLSASAAVLMDGESGRVLYARNPDQRRPIASITKLMTALVAVRLCPDLSAEVTVRPEWTGVEGSSMYLRPGERLTREALLYGLLLSSGNDAALAIAGSCCETVEAFVARMNETAAGLGMDNTHFANPNGLDDPEHYSTAYDMALLARAVLEEESLRRIAGSRTAAVAGRSLANHNKLLWRYEGCTGLKTGYTDEAGRTLVSSALRDGQELIAVTLNDPNDWADHEALFDYGFSTYPRTLAVEAGTGWLIPCGGSLGRFVSAGLEREVYYPLAEGERLSPAVSLPQRVEAPVTAGAPAGELVLSLEGEPVMRLPLCYQTGAADDRAPAGWLERLLGLTAAIG